MLTRNHIDIFVGTEGGNRLFNTNVPCYPVMCFRKVSTESQCLSSRVAIVAITATLRARIHTVGIVVQTSVATIPDRCIGYYKANAIASRHCSQLIWFIS